MTRSVGGSAPEQERLLSTKSQRASKALLWEQIQALESALTPARDLAVLAPQEFVALMKVAAARVEKLNQKPALDQAKLAEPPAGEER
jgi:hypothetical protein